MIIISSNCVLDWTASSDLSLIYIYIYLIYHISKKKIYIYMFVVTYKINCDLDFTSIIIWINVLFLNFITNLVHVAVLIYKYIRGSLKSGEVDRKLYLSLILKWISLVISIYHIVFCILCLSMCLFNRRVLEKNRKNMLFFISSTAK